MFVPGPRMNQGGEEVMKRALCGLPPIGDSGLLQKKCRLLLRKSARSAGKNAAYSHANLRDPRERMPHTSA